MRSALGPQDKGLRPSLRAARVHAWSPGGGRSFPYHAAPMALVLVLCALIAHGQSAIDSGRAVPATRPATLTKDSTGWLAGRVVQGDGAPVAGAVVSVVGASDSALTASDGHFELHWLPFGAHMVTVRRLGFAMKRFALTIAPGVTPDVAITMTRFVPVLPTVTTTAEERAAYRSVGFDTRMKAGIGQFLTYEQITKKQPGQLTDLLQGMNGIHVWQSPYAGIGMSVEGTRGPGSCVTYVIDGIQQNRILELTPAGKVPESPDNLIEASQIGAMEVYESSERPAGFGGMIQNPEEQLPRGPNLIPGQQCVLVMIWTRARLGLVGAQETPSGKTANNTMQKEPTRAVTTFALDSSCSPPPPRDTTDLLVYATVVGARPDAMSDAAWADYKYHVLVAIDRWAELPSELFLPSFSLPVSPQGQRGTASGGGGSEVLVAPSLSTVLAFSLDSSGALTRARVAASSLSDGADTSVLAMVEQAAAAHAFPHLPTGVNSAALYLVVQSAEPTMDTLAAALGTLEVPEWRLSRPARLVRGPLPDGLVADSTAPHRVPVMMAVDATGHVVGGTARLWTGASLPVHASPESQAAVLKTLPDVRFDPALIGSCRVGEFIVESFTPPKAQQR